MHASSLHSLQLQDTSDVPAGWHVAFPAALVWLLRKPDMRVLGMHASRCMHTKRVRLDGLVAL